MPNFIVVMIPSAALYCEASLTCVVAMPLTALYPDYPRRSRLCSPGPRSL